MGKDQFSKTMRIDLIPVAPSEPVKGKKRRVVVSKSAEPVLPASSGDEGQVEDTPYQRLLQSVYDAALIADLTGKVVDVNARAEDFLQYERAELCQMTVFEVISGADESLIETLCENLENERFTLIQAYCMRKDGSMFPAEIAVNKLRLDEMNLCFFVRDITLRRQAEEMLRTEHSAIQNAGNGIAVVDVECRLEYVNPAVATMWGYDSPDDVVGFDVRDLLSDRTMADTMIEQAMVQRKSWMDETKASRRDGSEFDVQIAAVCNVNSDGETDGMVLSFVDTSDRKRAVEAEREAERRRVMLESLGAACHHLGQPATILLGNLSIIRKKAAGRDEDLGGLVEASIGAAKELGQILHKLNAVNEYRTTQYLGKAEDKDAEEHRILDI